MKLHSALILFLAAGPGALAFQSARPISRPWGTCMSMSTKAVEVKRLADSAVEIQIPVPGSATKAAYDKVCTELSKNIQIPGFRKGSKIPPQVLEQNMAAKGGRNALKVQAINELVNQLIEPSLKEHALDPIGTPSLIVSAEELAESFKAGEELTLQVKCDVWPEIQWKPTPEGKEKVYFGLKGKYKRKPFNQQKLDMALRDLKERYATLEPIDDASHVLAMGDACTVNMVGYMAAADGSKGEPLPNAASGDNVEVVLGPGRYMEGLVEGIVGHKKGDKVTVDVCFPEKLRDKSLAGKRALFDVEILDCSKRSVPQITDEFAQKVKDGLTAESLMAELRKAIDEEDAKEFVPERNAALGKALAECMDVQVPDTLVTNQAREKFAMMMAEMRDGGVDDAEIKRQINPENFAKYKDIVKDDIIRDFKVSMATDEIARLEGLTVPDYQIEEQMQAIRKDAEGSEDFDENMVRMKVETTLQRQAVFDFLAERAELEVEYADEKFDEKLLEKLAEESLKREEEIIAEKEVSAPEPVAVEEPVVEEPEPVVEKESEPVAVAEPVVEEEPEPVAVAEPVVEEEPEPVVEEKPEPVAEKKEEPKPVERDWASMTLEEKAYAALVDAGAFTPSDP